MTREYDVDSGMILIDGQDLTKRIQDLLAITKLLTVFEVYESEPDAIKSFS